MITKGLILLINLLLLSFTIWGTIQQIATQKETNRVMAQVHDNIRLAGKLTADTNQKLKPLQATAESIEEMNTKLSRTNGKLQKMNGSLSRVVESEGKIVKGLDSLNGNTALVITQLNALKAQNEELIAPSSRVAGQTQQEHATLERLYSLTGTSIRELATVNRKFAVLGALPLPR
ncbi:hypothetical protein [Salinithrix halophila]|uniref:Uncharacterized protein n=1 Tax=Salinithrix halophila TaxID=1485204 RepID=A0ABV8JGS9_9BACL